MKLNNEIGQFQFEPDKNEPKESVLYREHLKHVKESRMVSFAGYRMPVRFSSIQKEHQAVRRTAGIFDCTHMGCIEISGMQAATFLNLITTNNVTSLANMQAQYSYILDAAGNVLDDIIVYRIKKRRFMLVVNAANEPKIKAYLNGLITGQVILDVENPDKKLKQKPKIRDMKDTTTGKDCRVDIALQGPASKNILFELNSDEKFAKKLENLKPFTFAQAELDNMDCIISRTGYTGSRIGYELFIHPDNAVSLWNKLIDAGKNHGIELCGLASRDSLRIEAGLPLYGHEIDGTHDISPIEAGYGWAVKFEKDFFIGKDPMINRSEVYQMKVFRIQMPGEKGVRPVRENAPVISDRGNCLGWVLSAAKAMDKQYLLAYLKKDSVREGTPLAAQYPQRAKKAQTQSVSLGEKLEPDIYGTVVRRFAKF